MKHATILRSRNGRVEPRPLLVSVAYEMALEQILAELDDLEERVENLNVDQKTNEDILLNVLKRVDETEKDLRKVGRYSKSPARFPLLVVVHVLMQSC